MSSIDEALAKVRAGRLECELVMVNELLKATERYVALLEEELSDAWTLLTPRGYASPQARVERGRQLRDQIAEMKRSLEEDEP